MDHTNKVVFKEIQNPCIHIYMHSWVYLEKFLLTLILMISVWWSKFGIFGMLQTFPP